MRRRRLSVATATVALGALALTQPIEARATTPYGCGFCHYGSCQNIQEIMGRCFSECGDFDFLSYACWESTLSCSGGFAVACWWT